VVLQLVRSHEPPVREMKEKKELSVKVKLQLDNVNMFALKLIRDKDV
jgi:hypothetical protein